MLTVTKIFEFEAAHHLPGYDGKCKNLHGHSYTLEVEICGPPIGCSVNANMVLDFSVLKKDINNLIIDKLDHSNLNKKFKYPSAEVIVEWIIRILLNRYGNNLIRVRLWETSTSYAEWRRE